MLVYLINWSLVLLISSQAATGVRDLDDLVERFTSHKENRRMIEAEKRVKDKKLRERKRERKALKVALEQAILDSRDAEAAATASSAIIKEKYDKLEARKQKQNRRTP